jgi:hypothetical protein
MTTEQREKAWAAAQALYDALPTYGTADVLGGILISADALRDFEPTDKEIIHEIGSRLWTLHDEDSK